MPNRSDELEDYWSAVLGLPDIPCTEDGTRRPAGIFGAADPDFQTFCAALGAAAAERQGAFHVHLFERLTAYGAVPRCVMEFRGDKTLGGQEGQTVGGLIRQHFEQPLRGRPQVTTLLDDAADFSQSERIRITSTFGDAKTEIASPAEDIVDALDVLGELFD